MTCILGIESSCDETAAAVVDAQLRVRSNIVASQEDLHAEYGGVVPEIASRAHAEQIVPVVRAALDRAGLARPDAVAATAGPGLIGAVLFRVMQDVIGNITLQYWQFWLGLVLVLLGLATLKVR